MHLLDYYSTPLESLNTLLSNLKFLDSLARKKSSKIELKVDDFEKENS